MNNKWSFDELNISIENLENILPQNYLFWCKFNRESISSLVMYLARCDGETVGYAVYVYMKAYILTPELLYVNVSPEYIGSGYAIEIVNRTSNYIMKRDKRVRVRVQVDEGMEELVPILKASGFKLEREANMLVYTIGDIRESEMVKKLPQMEPLLKCVKSYDEIIVPGKYDVDEFLLELERTRIKVDISKLDPKYTRFYVSGQKISGYMAMTPACEDVICMYDLFVSDSPNLRYAIPAMLASLVSLIKDDFSEDTHVIMYFMIGHNVEGTVKALGEPDEMEFLSMYMK